MPDLRCCVCFEPFDSETEPRYTQFEFLPDEDGSERTPSNLSFCKDCHVRLRKVTDNWESEGPLDISCVFCGIDSADGTRISAEELRANGQGGYATLMPSYDLCPKCNGIFESFLQGERAEVLGLDGYEIFDPTDDRPFGVGKNGTELHVEATMKRTESGVTHTVRGDLDETNCYSVVLHRAVNTASHRLNDMVTFDDPDDAIEFAQLVALFAVDRTFEYIDSEFEPEPHDDDPWCPDPIVTDLEPIEVAEKMLGPYFYLLEQKIEEQPA